MEINAMTDTETLDWIAANLRNGQLDNEECLGAIARLVEATGRKVW